MTLPTAKRHAVVIPSLGTPPSPSCGGPAFCATCNAEMIELEQLAFNLAVKVKRFEWKRYAGDDDDESLKKAVGRAWIGQKGFAQKYRDRMVDRIRRNTPEARSAHARHAGLSGTPEFRHARAMKANEAARLARWGGLTKSREASK